MYLESNAIFHSMTHGYRKSHSCVTAIMEMYEEAMIAYEEGKFFGANPYDQSSAFELVDYQVLQSPPEILGFDGHTRSWFSSFLEGRSQYVQVGGEKSKICSIESGSPQGSSSGPILWLIYTLELPDLMVQKMETTLPGDVQVEEPEVDQHQNDRARPMARMKVN